MKSTILLILFVALALSCKNSLNESTEEPEHKSTMVFGDTLFSFPEFSFPLVDNTVRWGVLEDFLSEAKELNGSNFQTLKNRSERLVEYSDSLIKKTPDTLDISPIRSRLIVLKTRAEMLHQYTHQGILDSANLQESVMEMNSAVSNFIIRLNEKFQKDKIDSQRKENERREFLDQNRFNDSILELERQNAMDNDM